MYLAPVTHTVHQMQKGKMYGLIKIRYGSYRKGEGQKKN